MRCSTSWPWSTPFTPPREAPDPLRLLVSCCRTCRTKATLPFSTPPLDVFRTGSPGKGKETLNMPMTSPPLVGGHFNGSPPLVGGVRGGGRKRRIANQTYKHHPSLRKYPLFVALPRHAGRNRRGLMVHAVSRVPPGLRSRRYFGGVGCAVSRAPFRYFLIDYLFFRCYLYSLPRGGAVW